MNIPANTIQAVKADTKIHSELKTEFLKRYFRVVHGLFAVLLLIQFLPDKLTTETYVSYVIWFAVGVEIFTLILSGFIKKTASLI